VHPSDLQLRLTASPGVQISGGLQFDGPTWRAYGGGEHAPSAAEATREQQIAVAEKLREDRGGYSAWPACSQRLGLE